MAVPTAERHFWKGVALCLAAAVIEFVNLHKKLRRVVFVIITFMAVATGGFAAMLLCSDLNQVEIQQVLISSHTAGIAVSGIALVAVFAGVISVILRKVISQPFSLVSRGVVLRKVRMNFFFSVWMSGGGIQGCVHRLAN